MIAANPVVLILVKDLGMMNSTTASSFFLLLFYPWSMHILLWSYQRMTHNQRWNVPKNKMILKWKQANEEIGDVIAPSHTSS
jgi:hypothetical protein